MLRHTGSYETLSSKFETLFEWVDANSVPFQRTIGIYWDNPEFTPEHQLRSAACIEVPATFTGPLGPSLEFGNLAGGEYAVASFTGPYEQLEPVWSKLINYVESGMRKEISDQPAYEVYLNDPADTPADQLITELYLPLA
jgi:AraC family transcriptional regulator